MVLNAKSGTKEILGQMVDRIRLENEALKRLIAALEKMKFEPGKKLKINKT